MPLVTTPATILKTYDYSETSKILRLLTRDHGLCSVIAKGARRPKSRFGGLLEPFTDGVATYYAKDGRDLQTLSGFDLERERQALGSQLVRFAGASLVTEIVLRFAAESADEGLFEKLRSALDRLVREEGDLETAILEETWGVIGCLGFAPGVERCGECQQVPATESKLYFDPAEGILICEACRTIGGARKLLELTPDAAAELASLVTAWGRKDRTRTGRTQRSILDAFMLYHLTDDRPLRSLRFLDERLG